MLKPSKINELFHEPTEGTVPLYITKNNQTGKKHDEIFSAHRCTSVSFILKHCKCHIYTIIAACVVGTMPSAKH